MSMILAAGFNPARQKVIRFEKLIPGKVNRAVSSEEFASGKGINFCRAAGCWQQSVAFLIQFCGGDNGSFIEACLRDEGIDFYSVKTCAGTRCCDTCVDLSGGEVTELIEPSYPATAQEVEEYASKFREMLNSASAAAFCGTLPGGTDSTLYARLAGYTAAAGVPLLVDAWRDVDDIFASGAEIVLKINREELLALTACEGVGSALRHLYNRWGICKAAITDGPGKAYAFDGKTVMQYTLPVLEKVVNPIGCGDTASAVLLSEMLCSGDIFESFRNALGAASANCLNSFCGNFQKSDAVELAAAVKMEELRTP